MSLITGKTGSIYSVNDITVFTTEATTEAGATKIYQIDAVAKRVWDPNVSITINVGAFDRSYYDNGVNWFEGKVKLLTTGEGTLTVTGASMTIAKVGEVHGWGLNLNIDVAERTRIGDTWKRNESLGKSASVTVSRYRTDDNTLFDSDDSGHQECGLSGKTLTTATGLAGTTQYYFKINIDGAGVIEYDITTAADMTFAAVIALINTALVAAGAKFSIEAGDLRCKSSTGGPDSSIALSAGTTGADLFATLTDWAAFDEAVAGSYNVGYFLLKLLEDGDSGYWCKAIKTTLGIAKAINAIDQESSTFEVDANVVTF